MSPKGDIRGLPGGRLSAPPAVKGLKQGSRFATLIYTI